MKVTIVEFEDGEIRLFKDLNPDILTHMWIGDTIESAYCLTGEKAGEIIHNYLFNPKTLRQIVRMDELIPGTS